MAKDKTQANRGRSFEEKIIRVNEKYAADGMAIIQKIPTTWVVRRQGARIVSAFPSQKSTVDFIGMIAAKEDRETIPVAFEAKETTGTKGEPKTRFPLYVHNKKRMVSEHQLEFLKAWNRSGGHGFILIHFKNRDKYFAVTPGFIREWYEQTERKSIPYEAFKTQREVNINDYLEIY